MTVAINTLAMRSPAHGVGRYIGGIVPELLREDAGRYLIYSAPSFVERWRAAGARRVKAVTPVRGFRLLWEQTLLPADLRGERAAVFWGPAHAVPLWRTTRQVLTIHDLTWFTLPHLHSRLKAAYFRTMLRATSRRADRIVASSRATANDVECILKVPHDRIRVVLLAPDQAFRPASAAAIDAARRRYDLPREFILSLGVIEPRKNLRGLVAAVDHWAAKGAALPLLVAGSLDYGWQTRAVTQAIHESRASVRLIGQIPDAELPAVISAATVLAYVPFAEGFGLPLIEAMSCGTPVVASTADALREVGGDAALFVDPRDVVAMADALEGLARDPVKREALRSAGLARSRLFNWRSAAAQLTAIFDELEMPHDG